MGYISKNCKYQSFCTVDLDLEYCDYFEKVLKYGEDDCEGCEIDTAKLRL